ncbi:MAG: nicotinate-nucleotide--dimethylbenzimidazole phosphoribosyltransferase [Verrucomicrobia bacterium]|nr:nicotinate-nucleotide--dimethylbenzimidazole phosphoribosyltransferase [Verrucomicrobiota bacterium]
MKPAQNLASSIQTSASDIADRAFAEINKKTKPRGSLGTLENLAVQIAQITGTLSPVLSKKRICVFAASHGVVAEKVSAYPPEVTAQMLQNFLVGGAAINVLARHFGIDLHVIDVGVDPVSEKLCTTSNFYPRRVSAGTKNFVTDSAMTSEECTQAMRAGAEQVQIAAAGHIDLLGIGEMGIGNTTSASALVAALLDLPPKEVVGLGTGIDSETLNRKIDVVTRALAKHGPGVLQPAAQYWLQAVGGFEIAAMTGFILEAGKTRMAVAVDGFIATAAAAAAFQIDPSCRRVCFFSHQSAEAAHARVLAALEVAPILNLGMRLGEGTGAALAMPILEAAAKILAEMATFDSARVSDQIRDWV